MAILGGLALASSFPKLGFAGFAWIAPGCILFAAMGRTGGEAFRIGYAGGFAYALGLSMDPVRPVSGRGNFWMVRPERLFGFVHGFLGVVLLENIPRETRIGWTPFERRAGRH